MVMDSKSKRRNNEDEYADDEEVGCEWHLLLSNGICGICYPRVMTCILKNTCTTRASVMSSVRAWNDAVREGTPFSRA